MSRSTHVVRTLRPGETPPEGVEPKRYRNDRGYVRLRWRVGVGEYVECYEHRWVAGCHDPAVQVHHRNGVKNDNRPENLEVISAGAHARLHGQCVDLDEMCRLYGQGKSTTEVGRALGVHASTISRALRRAGVAPRDLSESVALWHRNRGGES